MEHIRVELHDQPSSRAYDIRVGCGTIGDIGSFVAERFPAPRRKIALVTTDRVPAQYIATAAESLRAAGFALTSVVIPDGEEHKTIATWATILDELIAARFERSSVIVPLGGGVVGDMAGFAAASLLRGIAFIPVPTTIVAQVDSSIGGKVAVDHPLGKNLIGAFHQPSGVLIDPRVLATLEHREVVSGMAEAVKHAIIRDPSFFSFLEEHLEALMTHTAPDSILEAFIARNCHIKAAVVGADERESGLRAILNYGHTIGHAIETVTGYARFRHGEAVLLGMVAAAGIARERGMFGADDLERHHALLQRVGIPGDLGTIDPGALLDAMTRDKKVAGESVRFILPTGIGSVDIVSDVTESQVRAGIDHLIGVVSGR